MSPTLTRADIHRICAESGADERTVERYLRGESSWASVQERIEVAMRALGLAEHLPDPRPTPLRRSRPRI